MAKQQNCSMIWIIQICICNQYIKLLLLLGGDIETNPGPNTALVLTDYTKKVVTGNFHQGSLISSLGATSSSTCMPNSLIALAYFNILDLCFWDSSVIDSILYLGKSLYEKLYPHRHNKDSCTYLQATDIDFLTYISPKKIYCPMTRPTQIFMTQPWINSLTCHISTEHPQQSVKHTALNY